MIIFQGGNDYEIFVDERTIGHTVVSPEDTMAQLKKLFYSWTFLKEEIREWMDCFSHRSYSLLEKIIGSKYNIVISLKSKWI